MSNREQYDYIIVGSGAGGGPLAANLAKAGYKVCLMDAGKRPDTQSSNYAIPVFHPAATEDPKLGWYAYVRHFTDDDLQKKDDKYQKTDAPDEKAPANGDPAECRDVPIPDLDYRYPREMPKDGVFYPRASAVGGCTVHHAMICVYPHNKDWEEIVELTGDWTWNPENMRRYFVELERCNYRPILKKLYQWFGWNPTRHGFKGWLPTKVANLGLLKQDKQLAKLLLDSAIAATIGRPNWWRRLKITALNLGDFNAWQLVKKNATGIRQTALSVNGVRRSAVNEYVVEVEKQCPENLTVLTGVLVKQVLFEDRPDRDGDWVARGVLYHEKEDIYENAASYNPGDEDLGPEKELRCNREVILAGGAYQTPQTLMLSGIGDHTCLRGVGMAERELKVHLPGVGRNLQDRYEVGLVQEMNHDFPVLHGSTLSDKPNDRLYQQWKRGGDGVYATNGAVISIIKQSQASQRCGGLPDLYIFGVVGPFRGYEPGYSCPIKHTRRKFTWAILKGHACDFQGHVELHRDDPLNFRRQPYVNFGSFLDGEFEKSADMDAMIEAVQFVRSMTKEAEEVIAKEEYPGHDRVPTHDVGKLREWIGQNAWGHHCSCTTPMGLRSHSVVDNQNKGYLSVLDGKFRVFGTKNLRVVDASVFPKIPGFFIVLPIFMISQKASDQIIQDARAADRSRRS